jgi:hypothetical protein
MEALIGDETERPDIIASADDPEALAARNGLGYGNWDASYWVGMEPGEPTPMLPMRLRRSSTERSESNALSIISNQTARYGTAEITHDERGLRLTILRPHDIAV